MGGGHDGPMTTPWRIRRAGAGDAADLARLASRTFPRACPAWMAPADVQRHIDTVLTADAFTADLLRADTRVWIASAPDSCIGYVMTVAGAADPDHAPTGSLLLQRLYVDEGWHGSGLAADLLAVAVAHARSAGHPALWLGTSQENIRALAFYRRQGFRIVGERVFRVGGTDNRDHVLMLTVPAETEYLP